MSNFGSVTALTAGAATLNQITTTPLQRFFFVQNNAVTVLTLTFKDGSSNTLGQIVLNPASVAGQGGGYVDSEGFPMFLEAASVVLAGTGTGAFSSGASTLIGQRTFLETRISQ